MSNLEFVADLVNHQEMSSIDAILYAEEMEQVELDRELQNLENKEYFWHLNSSQRDTILSEMI